MFCCSASTRHSITFTSVLLSLSTWVSSSMNTSAGTNMLKQFCLKLAGGSVCYDVFAVTSPNIVLMLFFLSMIRLTLEYCAGVWGCCGEVNSGTLKTLQKGVGGNRGYYMAARRNEISLRVLKNTRREISYLQAAM